MKHIVGFGLLIFTAGLLIFGLIAYIFKSDIEEQKIQIKNILIAPPNLSIETIQGKYLPTQKIVDDETLLGIDNNHNDIRDDIELKVFSTYKSSVDRALFLQAFRTRQRMMTDENLIKNARIWAKVYTKAMYCNSYLSQFKGKKLTRKMVDTINNWQLNNEKRVKKYFQYDQALSGGVYSIKNGTVQDCEFDIEAVLKLDENQSN